jgi:hypothetical protein
VFRLVRLDSRQRLDPKSRSALILAPLPISAPEAPSRGSRVSFT